jgi:tetratricopeptide (TPR) repeat protein
MTKGAGPDGGKAPVSFDAAVTEASLTAEWTVSDRETGAVIRAGRTTDVLKRSSGGWLAAQGAAPGDPPSEDEAKRILAEALSGQMVAELGPALSASGLERAGDPQSRKALALAAAGHWEEAAELWREVIALNPDHAAAHYNLGLHHERLGELDEAWASYRLAFLCLGAPIHREALTRLTDALNRQGRPPRPSGSALGGEGTWR